MKTSTIHILLVDDDPVFTHLACQLLDSLEDGFVCHVTSLADGKLALGSVGQGRYDLALLDYNLPGANGLEILAEIQQLPLSQQPAVIMLTASGNESVAVEAMKRGAKDYLQKLDLDIPALTRAIQSALNQKRLSEQVETYNLQLEADLDMARKLQESLLPQHYPTFPRSATADQSALRFHHRFSWTTRLGGDFFSVQDLSDTQAGVFICDVMGHGVRSALVTAMLRALVGDMASVGLKPDSFLSGMNERLTAIFKEIGETMFATAFYMVADVSCGKLLYARAGHPAPLHLRRTTGVAEYLPFPKSPGPALGLFENAKYTLCERELAPNDSLLLFTDGLYEVTTPDGEEYGTVRLLESARQRMGLPLQQVVDGLITDVQKFSEDVEFEDDVCLLGMDVTRVGVNT